MADILGIPYFYPHTFAESHGCKAVDECGYSSGEARNRQSHTCKGVEVYYGSAAAYRAAFVKKIDKLPKIE